jgi:hypothetical protein
MQRRALSTAALTAFVVLTNSAVALAAACNTNHDVTRVGDCAKGIVSANAKAIWWILLVVGVLSALTSRRAGRAVASIVLIIISGIAIYNPNGVGALMSNFAGALV